MNVRTMTILGFVLGYWLLTIFAFTLIWLFIVISAAVIASEDDGDMPGNDFWMTPGATGVYSLPPFSSRP